MNPKKLKEFLNQKGEPSYRASQILKAVYSGISSYENISVLPKNLKESLSTEIPILSLTSETIQTAKDGTAHKARLRLQTGHLIETVLMQPKPNLWSVCVSSQVGCGLSCSFCATGLMGFTRNLTTEEIADQLLFWKQYIRERGTEARISNVVYMGMGEPMLNFDAVKESILQLTDPDLFALSRRSITVSSAGVVPGIERFANELKQVNLALSLHAANNPLRTHLVPINKAYPLEKLAESLKRYFAKNNRKVFLEYVLLANENDQLKHGLELVRFIRHVGMEHLLHVNLITWNPTDTAHISTSREQAHTFKEFLIKHGILVTIRKNLGKDISAACGQLLS